MSLSDRIASARQQQDLDAFAADIAEIERRRRLDVASAPQGSGLHWLAEETELERLGRELALDSRELAAAIGISDVMLMRWQRGLLEPSAPTAERLDRIRQFHARLTSIFEPYQARDWMRSPNPRLDEAIPAELLIAGALHRLEAALDYLES